MLMISRKVRLTLCLIFLAALWGGIFALDTIPVTHAAGNETKSISHNLIFSRSNSPELLRTSSKSSQVQFAESNVIVSSQENATWFSFDTTKMAAIYISISQWALEKTCLVLAQHFSLESGVNGSGTSFSAPIAPAAVFFLAGNPAGKTGNVSAALKNAVDHYPTTCQLCYNPGLGSGRLDFALLFNYAKKTGSGQQV